MTENRPPVEPNPRVFWPLALVGWAVLVYGVVGVLNDASRTHPARWVTWFLGAALVHDFVIAPLVFLVGGKVAAHSSRAGRHLLQAGLITSALTAVTALPVLLGFGRNPNDPSTLPNDYVTGLAWVLAATWVVVGIATLMSRRRRSSIDVRSATDPSRR